MARVVDQNRKRQRDDFRTLVLFAASDLSALTAAASDLMSETEALIGPGHPVSDRLLWASGSAREALARSRELLSQAAVAAHGIDITVEVPDPEPAER